ncbi:hypothetical protein V8J88_00350 [Massilia sp. W12]|uniref:hypothetical protein n=1 Tax=Massilia sp. W12 TaxID=3126507 RepID=UPI0030CB0E12
MKKHLTAALIMAACLHGQVFAANAMDSKSAANAAASHYQTIDLQTAEVRNTPLQFHADKKTEASLRAPIPAPASTWLVLGGLAVLGLFASRSSQHFA